MATYNNSYQYKVTPNTPDLRGLTTNYSNDGQTNLGGIGLGDLYELDYDRNKIEQIFNQGTDARYALMQKENQIAQNQYANNQFANQQTAIESLRQQRNEQISSGMARGLNAAQEQGTILGLQQDASAGALELANQQQLEADKIATEYADNVVKALEQSNAVKQAMASIAAQLYEADMLGYTGELGYLGQMDANASDRYGYELGLEGTKYSADKNLEGTKYTADKNYAASIYAADKSYAGALAQAAATKEAARISASSYGNGTQEEANFIEQCYKSGKNYEGMVNALQYNGVYTEDQAKKIASQYYTNINNSASNYASSRAKSTPTFINKQSNDVYDAALRNYKNQGSSSLFDKILGIFPKH